MRVDVWAHQRSTAGAIPALRSRLTEVEARLGDASCEVQCQVVTKRTCDRRLAEGVSQLEFPSWLCQHAMRSSRRRSCLRPRGDMDVLVVQMLTLGSEALMVNPPLTQDTTSSLDAYLEPGVRRHTPVRALQDLKDYLRKGKSLDELWAVANGHVKYNDFLNQAQGGNGNGKSKSNGKTVPRVPEELVGPPTCSAAPCACVNIAASLLVQS